MQIKPIKFDWKNKNKGQSFVELTFIFGILMVLLAGMVEFGTMLNEYINVVDGAREGARFVSNDDPFETGNYEPFFGKVYETVQGRYDISGVQLSKGALNPIVLNPDTDDIVATFFSVSMAKNGNPKSLRRFESAAGSRYHHKTSEFTDAEILAMIDDTAPSTGLLLVEVFYYYHQILKFFSWTGIPDPFLLHTFSIMPLSSAEPTPVPSPTP